MNEADLLAAAFESYRPRLQAAARRMLGNANEAEDAVQEAWLRLLARHRGEVENLGGWLMRVVGRVCLDRLRARRTQREEIVDAHLSDPIVVPDPEREALLADSVGMALQVILDRLTPPERIAFVLHDLFGLPFEEIGTIVGRSPVAARQLASRARRRVQAAARADGDPPAAQRALVDAFFAAAHRGDFSALLAVLDPDVRLRVDGGAARREWSVDVRGADAVARQVLRFANPSAALLPARIDGAAGVVARVDGKLFSIMAFHTAGGRITAIDAVVDPERLRRLDLRPFGG